MTVTNITAFTLVDITNTGTVRVRDSNTIEYHQQQNFNVLIQTIGLRTQVFQPQVTQYIEQDLSKLKFSDFYGVNTQHVWMLTFYVENLSVWDDGEDSIGLLRNDSHGVAITSDLNNTVEFPANIFDTLDNVNLYFELS